MNKIRGKVLSLVLAAALVVSSFPATFASASTHRTVKGDLNGDYNTDFYLVNGGKDDDLVLKGFGAKISANAGMTTDHHKDVDDVKISAISHKSGNRLVKWYDAGSTGDKTDSISDDTEDSNIDLKLRSKTESGSEVLNVQYKGTWTDDDDNEYTVKATKEVNVRVYNRYETVVGLASKDGEFNKKGELDDDFAQKTAAYEASAKKDADKKLTDSKDLAVLRAVPSTGDDPIEVEWEALKTVPYTKGGTSAYTDSTATTNNDSAYYLLKSSTDNITLDGTVTSAADSSFSGTCDPTDTTAGLSYDKTTHQITVTAPVNDYTLKYKVDPSTTYTAVPSDGIIKGLTNGQKVTVTAFGTDGKAVTGLTDYSFTYTVTPATIGTPTAIGDNAPTLKLESDGSVTVTPADSAKAKVTYLVKDGTVKDITSGLSIPATDVTAGKEITVSAYAQATDSDVDSTATFTYTAAGVKIDGPTGTAASAKLNNDKDVVVSNTAVTGASMTKKVGDASAVAVSDGGTIDLSSVADGTKVTVTTTIGGVSNSVSGTYSKDVAAGNDTNYVTAQVAPKATTGSFTLTAIPTTYGKAQTLQSTGSSIDHDAGESDSTSYLYSNSDVKQKAKIAKQVKVSSAKISDGFVNLGKRSTTTYLYKGTLDKDTPKADEVKVSGYEVNFDDSANHAGVKVDDKASVSKISGTVKSLSIAGKSNVQEIALSHGDQGAIVSISDATVGNIDFDDHDGKVTVDSPKAKVGNITDADTVTVNSGVVGNVTATTEIDVKGQDDDTAVTTGDLKSKKIDIDSEDSKGITTGTLTAKDSGTVITLSGDNVKVKAVDFDYWDAELDADGFDGSIPAPQHADAEGAIITTQDADDKLAVTGDADINGLSIADSSTVTFDGGATIGSIDGSGTLVVGLDKLKVTSDASGVILKLSNPSFKVGDVAFTAVSDAVDVDDMNTYGFKVTKSEGSKTDSFKISKTEFQGLTIDPSAKEIAKGYSQTFKANTYAPGSAIPDGYKVQFTIDGDDSIFDMKDNGDGTATVKVVDYDKDFAEENKATLKAELVDADGDTNDDYSSGECALTAVPVPAQKFISDTTGNKAMKLGETYQFAITSTDGTKPSFAVASAGAAVTNAGASGNKYFFKVKAAKVGSYGVYAGGTKVAILVISSDVTLDTSKVTVKAGSSYQFEATAPKQPVFQVAGIGTIALRSHSGSNYYFKVTVPSKTAKGGHGVYVNGVRMAVLTVA